MGTSAAGAEDLDMWVGVAPASVRRSARDFLSTRGETLTDDEFDHYAVVLRRGPSPSHNASPGPCWSHRGPVARGRRGWRSHTRTLQRLFDALIEAMKARELAFVQAVVDSSSGLRWRPFEVARLYCCCRTAISGLAHEPKTYQAIPTWSFSPMAAQLTGVA